MREGTTAPCLGNNAQQPICIISDDSVASMAILQAARAGLSGGKYTPVTPCTCSLVLLLSSQSVNPVG
jgi:hypothetical protein